MQSGADVKLQAYERAKDEAWAVYLVAMREANKGGATCNASYKAMADAAAAQYAAATAATRVAWEKSLVEGFIRLVRGGVRE